MAHEIEKFAFVGDRSKIWHGLGTEIPANADIDTVVRAAGLNWQAMTAVPTYTLPDGTVRTWDGMRVQFRDDTGDALGLISAEKYNVVQPREIVEFFADFLADNKLNIDTAACLKKGRVVMCNARLGEDYRVNVMGVDPTDHYLTLVTSYDGTLATTAYMTGLRTVCMNTLRANLSHTDRSGKQWRTRHNSQFDSRALQNAVGLFGKELAMRAEVWNTLAETRVTDEQVARFFAEVIDVKPEDIGQFTKDGKSVVSTAKLNVIKAMAASYKNGPGSNLESASGTWYGALNAVTHYVDHEGRTRDTMGEGEDASRLYTVNFGTGAVTKAKAQKLAMQYAGIKVAA